MRDINNKISWLLIGIDLTLLFVLYPILVPHYLTEKHFLIGWLIFVGVSGLVIKFVIKYMKKRLKGE